MLSTDYGFRIKITESSFVASLAGLKPRVMLVHLLPDKSVLHLPDRRINHNKERMKDEQLLNKHQRAMCHET